MLNQGYVTPGYPLTPIVLHAMQKNTPKKQWNSPRYDRSQNRPILSERDLTYSVITSLSYSLWGQNFQGVSNWWRRGYWKFRRAPTLFTRYSRNSICGVRSTPLPPLSARVDCMLPKLMAMQAFAFRSWWKSCRWSLQCRLCTLQNKWSKVMFCGWQYNKRCFRSKGRKRRREKQNRKT